MLVAATLVIIEAEAKRGNKHDMHDELRKLLKQHGASLTTPRRKIFDLLVDEPPQTMQVLVKRAADDVDRATVYRTIELFERLGIVHRLNIGWKYKIELSEAFLGHHHHFYCTNCGRSYELEPSSMVESMIDSLTKKAGFAPKGHNLEIHGLCQNCQSTN